MSEHAVEDEQQHHRLDPTGHCIDHPQIRVRRPNANGNGWRTVLTNGCPLCAVIPVKTIPRRTSNNSRALTRMDSGSSSARSRGRSLYPEDHDYSPSYCSASDITETTVASSISSTSGHSITDYTPLSPGSTTSSKSNKRVVCGMRYVDPDTQRAGSYTGQVSPESQLPNGIGCLSLHDGETLDGEWGMGRLASRGETQPKSKGQQQRHPSRRGRERLTESFSRSSSRSALLDEDEKARQNEKAQQKSLARHPSRCRRQSLGRSFRVDEPNQHRKPLPSRQPSRSRRDALSRSHRFEEEEETNSINGDNNSLGSHGEHTVGTYSARESKGCRLPKKTSGIGCTGDRRRRSYMEVKH